MRDEPPQVIACHGVCGGIEDLEAVGGDLSPQVHYGDSKTFDTPVEDAPYGPEVKMEKHECIGHIQKCVTPRVKAATVKFKANMAAGKKVKLLKDEIMEVRKMYALKRGRGNMRC